MKKIAVLSFISLLALFNFASLEAHAMGRAHPIPVATPTPVPGGATSKPIPGAESCVSSDPNHICIGLKLVSYVKSGTPVLDENAAIQLVHDISNVWSPCNIGFQLETYQAIDPTTVGLSYNTNWKSSGNLVRNTFNDNTSFLVVAVGTLSGSTIGVTEMRGAQSHGSLIEGAYANNPLTVGHELGHYQGLYHVSSRSNLMYAYIGSHTADLTSDQCTTARTTDLNDWQIMIRKP